MTLKQAALAVTALRCRPDDLTLTWQNSTYSVYNAVWLRDNDPMRRDPETGERIATVTDLPAEPKILSAEPSPLGHITVNWEDGLTSVYSLSWLKAYDRSLTLGLRPTQMPWVGQPAANFASCGYAQWMADPYAREDFLYYAARDGVSFLRDVPREEGTVLRIADSIGYVRETNKGRVFEIGRASPRPPLPAHTDQPYRDPVPGFRMLHCLSAAGNRIILVDGMAAAQHLRVQDADAFAILCQIPVWFRYQDASVDFAAERALLAMDPHGQFHTICYNDRYIAPLPLKTPQLKKFYPAYRQFAALLEETARQVVYQMQPGDLLLLDNTRILHGHTALDAESPHHLQGCYLDTDGLYSSLAVLARQRSKQNDSQQP
jgi:alpha-ketoglutarate-dependent taurine dioxygenase